MKIKITIESRDYSKYIVECLDTNQEDVKVDLTEYKVFSGDVIKINENGDIERLESPVRSSEHVGILQLDSNKTYGRTENKKRLLYRCVPYNARLPDFLIPYEIKLGFQKSISNKYVVFKVLEWTDKHPLGTLVETIGDVDSIAGFCEYQLLCKNLNFSIKNITNFANGWTKNNHLEKFIETSNFIDRRKDRVFTIDPRGSKDLDDGFSISSMDDGKKRISIHIANVALILEWMNAGNEMGNRVSTIYLPDRIRPMLPRNISEDLCSLLKGKDKIAFTMDVLVDRSGKICESGIEFSNTIINVRKNYDYEDPILESDSDYLYLKDASKMKNSHDVVEYWMTYMNSACAEKLKHQGSGIFRSVKYIDKTKVKKTGSEYDAIMTQWRNINSSYVWFNNNTEHDIMGKSEYIHITSPIRRLVDIINQLVFLSEIMNIQLSDGALGFVNEWKSKLTDVNKSMKSIRKIQNECSILHKIQSNEELLNRSYEGIILDKNEKNGTFKYTVYIKELNIISFMKRDQDIGFEDYRVENFRLFLFENESSTKKKIRVDIIPQ
jgi:exoribonuclease R